MRIIHSPDCLAEGAAWLAAADPRLAEALALAGPLPLRRTTDGYAQLLRSIVSQQVSVAAARTIFGRLESQGLTTPEAVLAADEEALRAVGLSRQKARYAKALADAGIDFDALRGLPTGEVVRILVQVPGIGVWTAEIYAMFALGHADVFAPGDLALQVGAQMVLGLPERPKEKPLRQLAEAWSPWRSVAANLLWVHYTRATTRDGVA